MPYLWRILKVEQLRIGNDDPALLPVFAEAALLLQPAG